MKNLTISNTNLINNFLNSAPEKAIIIVVATPCIMYAINKLAEVANNAINKNCGLSCSYQEFKLDVNPAV